MDTSMYKSYSPPQSSAHLDQMMLPRKHSRKDSIQIAFGDEPEQLTVKHEYKKVKAVILVGGPKQGTAFRPLSLNCPKPLIPIAGRPAIMHLIERTLDLEGLTEILLIGGYSESSFSSFIRSAQRSIGVPLRYLQEYTSLGTAGGIFHFRDLISRGSPDAVVVIHGNTCSDVKLQDVLEFHACVGNGDHCTMVSVQAREDQAHQYGVAVSHQDTHAVMHYVEKPASFVSANINTGIYVISTAVFDTIKDIACGHEGDIKECIMFETDIIPGLVNENRVFMYESKAFWSQVKTAGTAVYANRHYLAQYRTREPSTLAQQTENGPVIVGDVFIHPTAHVAASAKLGPNVSIGPNVKVLAGARVKDAIILDNSEVSDHACVFNSVVGWNSRIGRWSRVEGLPVNADPNDPSTHISQKPLFNAEGKLEPSITVLGEGVSVEDEVIVLHSIVLPHKHLSKDKKNEIIL